MGQETSTRLLDKLAFAFPFCLPRLPLRLRAKLRRRPSWPLWAMSPGRCWSTILHIRMEASRRAVAALAKLATGTPYIEPRSPWENGYGEIFNGKLRDECLNGEIFYSRGEM